jgi:hypothetical protein
MINALFEDLCGQRVGRLGMSGGSSIIMDVPRCRLAAAFCWLLRQPPNVREAMNTRPTTS